ncbi:MAG: DNA recombination protein RmuC [Pseudomonadota bacterium]|nr:DNA recombination protein RmuC [Pseudomonadota bacterium]
MSDILCHVLLAANGLLLALVVVLLFKSSARPLTAIDRRLEGMEGRQERMERAIREDGARDREELSRSLRDATESLLGRLAENISLQKGQWEIFSRQVADLAAQSIQKLDRIDESVTLRLRHLQEDQRRQLEAIRATVDEKLQDTLEKRLGESFRLVSERLETVQKGLGEMQTLAAGVGDLKKVLTNIKARGTYGEIRLGALLEEILSPDQYAANVATRPDSDNRVEFAVRMPGRRDDPRQTVWLPLDAKFPQEDHLRLLEAQEEGNPARLEEASRQLERTLRDMARDIRDKYLAPPHTTDFAIMFLPTESLYAEVLRRDGLFAQLQREFRVVITGPTTLAALLNSLQMGFRTLAIERRTSEAWELLNAVKTEFANFGGILEKTHKKIIEAGNTIEKAAVRSRAIERRLRDVQDLPVPEDPAENRG